MNSHIFTNQTTVSGSASISNTLNNSASGSDKKILLPRIKYSNSNIFDSSYSKKPKTRRVAIQKRNLYLTEMKSHEDQKSLGQVQTEPTEKSHSRSNSAATHQKVLSEGGNNVIDGKFMQKLANILSKSQAPKKKIIKTYKPINKRYSTQEYLDKTREIVRMRYSLNLKMQTQNQIEENVKNEIKGIEETMVSLEKYRDEFETNFYNNYNVKLKKLLADLEKERNVIYGLYQEVVQKRKENNLILNQIHKREIEKNNIEKWIILQLEVKNKKQPKNLKKELAQFKGGFLYKDVEDFNDEFTKLENHNLNLLKEYNKVRKIIDELIQKRDEPLKENELIDKELNELIADKQKILNGLKKENARLQEQKNEVEKYSQIVPILKKKKKITSSLNFEAVNYINFQILHSKTKDLLYHMINVLYNNIIYNVNDETLPQNLKNYNRLDRMKKMLISIERGIYQIYKSFNYFKEKNWMYGKRINELQCSLEMKHKKEKAEKNRQIEEKKFKEFKEKIEEKNKRVFYKPNRLVDRYPAQLYCKPKKKQVETDINKEPGLEDFLYDE